MRKNKKADRTSLEPNQDRTILEFVGETAMILYNLHTEEKGAIH